ncbi:hydroxyacid dehydrogenase [bacterium LRH843]|nr:hydroxyacid dehydrogenase [bacterium LRH843]
MMTNYKLIHNVINEYDPINKKQVKKLWEEIRPSLHHKVIVLDDDPTGVQTVHGVSVYTDWSYEMIEQGFLEDTQLFFILTNSRAFTASETTKAHKEIAERVEQVSRKYNKPYLIVSRSDSTLRGHYPLETAVLKETIEKVSGDVIDGEIIFPFFKEGGRLTIGNVHYVRENDWLVPAGETEFAKDRTFGFQASHLGEWIEEKTNGKYTKDETTYISLESIRSLAIHDIENQLMNVKDFGKVVVNAVNEEDVTVFVIALIQALQKGKRFLFRTAAAFTKTIGDIPSRPLLTKNELTQQASDHGGLIMIGSHVQKTTEQLMELKTLRSLHFIELNSHLVLDNENFQKEIESVRVEAEKNVENGITTVIYTRRERLDLGEGMQEEELKLSVEISNAVTSIVRNFRVRPNYIIAKGGITSSDVGTKGLCVKRAIVAGQIASGIPVWQTGEESRFPHIPYVIFPGNVGTRSTLKEIVQTLEEE